MLEIELKYALGGHTAVEELADRIDRLGATRRPAVRQVDRYFVHPCRDFSATDEAFRLRVDGDRLAVTYKGPKLDRATKTRREIELPLGGGATPGHGGDQGEPSVGDRLAAFTELWAALGFTPVRDVAKTRTPWTVARDGGPVGVLLDEVDGLGPFAELETFGDEATLPARRATLLALAAELGLATPERRSYLELLLAADGERAAPDDGLA